MSQETEADPNASTTYSRVTGYRALLLPVSNTLVLLIALLAIVVRGAGIISPWAMVVTVASLTVIYAVILLVSLWRANRTEPTETGGEA